MPILRRWFVTMLVALSSLPCAAADDPPVIPLWENGPPGFENRKNDAEVIDKGTITNVHYPTLTVFLPERSQATGVGMLGFSAGGEVVSITSYRPGAGSPDAADPVDRLDGRPAFQMLVYPGPLGIPSRLPADSPPAFMVIAADDPHTSVVINLMHLFRESGIDYEAHIYARGGHGFGVKKSTRKSLEHWPDRMLDWLHDEVVVAPAPAK